MTASECQKSDAPVRGGCQYVVWYGLRSGRRCTDRSSKTKKVLLLCRKKML